MSKHVIESNNKYSPISTMEYLFSERFIIQNLVKNVINIAIDFLRKLILHVSNTEIFLSSTSIFNLKFNEEPLHHALENTFIILRLSTMSSYLTTEISCRLVNKD